MHKSSMLRMQWFANKYIGDQKYLNVLDVGSYDVNGCYREIFEEKDCNYTGLDMEKGPNVDIVPQSSYIWEEIENDKYDIVISGQALEHIEFFWVTLEEIVRTTKEGGLICIIAPNGFKEHRYPVDCWRFFTDGMVALARYFELEVIHAHTNTAPNKNDHEWFSKDEADSMLIAKKNYRGRARKINLKDYKCSPVDQQEARGRMYTYSEYRKEMKKESDMPSSESEETVRRKKNREKIKNKIREARDRISNFMKSIKE